MLNENNYRIEVYSIEHTSSFFCVINGMRYDIIRRNEGLPIKDIREYTYTPASNHILLGEYVVESNIGRSIAAIELFSRLMPEAYI